MQTKTNLAPRGTHWRFAIGLGAAIVFVLLAIIAWLASQRLIESRHESATAAIGQRAQLIGRLQAENERLKSEQHALLTEFPALGRMASEPEPAALAQRDAKRVAGIELLVQLETIGAISQNTSFLRDNFRVDRQGRLPDGFARFFDLPADQFEKLHEVLGKTRQHMEAAAIAGTTVRRENGSTVMMEIKVASEWAVQREHLRKAFLEVLGPEQMRAFERLGRGLDYVCKEMETKDWSTVVTRRPMSSNPADGFGYETKGTNRGGVRSTRDPGVPRRVVENSLGHWAKFLPADF